MHALELVAFFLLIGLTATVATIAAAVLISFDRGVPHTPPRPSHATPGRLVRFAPVPSVAPPSDAAVRSDPPSAA